MVILRIRSIDLDEQEKHLATDWEVSDTMNFTNVILRSVQNTKNLRSIIFQQELDPNTTYYGRARALTDRGYTEWGNLDVFHVINVVSLLENEDLPSNISIPIIKTSSNRGYLEANEHDTSLFNIEVSGFSVVGNAKHRSTSYWIEDVYTNVIWCSPYNELEPTKCAVNDIILKPNSVYRIKAMFHSTSEDSSQIATYTIHTNGGKSLDIPTYLDGLDVTKDNVIEVASADKYTRVYWEVLTYIDSFTQVIWSKEVDNRSYVTLPANTLFPNKTYIMRVATDSSRNSYKAITFKTL